MDTVERIAGEVTATYGLAPRDDWPESIGHLRGELRGADSGDRCLRSTLLKVAGRLTVPETHFMRHRVQLDFITRHISERLAPGAARHAASVWSAGCSTGEEPYSVAMCLVKTLGLPMASRVAITGTDISEAAIEKGQRAVYSTWSFRQTPAEVVEEFFDPEGPGAWRVRPEIRRLVTLGLAPIEEQLQQFADRSLEAVLFRNVGIYLTPEALERLFTGFRRVLTTGGLLCVAPSDPRPPRHLFTPADDSGTGIYAPASADRGCGPFGIEAARTRRPAPTEHPAEQPGARKPPCAGAARDRAMEAADRGDLALALELATGLVETEEGDGESYLLRGKVLLAGTGPEQHRSAVEDLRRAVFLMPGSAIARFWYATGLGVVGRTEKARSQAAAATQLLSARPDDQTLEDGRSRVKEIRDALDLLETTLR